MTDDQQIGFGDIWIKGDRTNSFLTKEGEKYIIRHKKSDVLIRNSKSIFCDRVEILKGLGIFYYFKDELTHFNQEQTLLIESSTSVITLRNAITREVISYFYLEEKDEKDFVFSNSKFEVGDLAYPSNLFLFESYQSTDKHNVVNILLGCLYKGELETGGLSNKAEGALKTFAFEIVEKVGDFYVIQLNRSSDGFESLVNEKFFAHDETLKTRDELLLIVNELKKALARP